LPSTVIDVVHGTVDPGVSPARSSARLLTLLNVEPGANCP
jgi:hypothetical protein